MSLFASGHQEGSISTNYKRRNTILGKASEECKTTRQTIYTVTKWKKRSERRKHCALVEPKIFAPPQTPFLGAQDGQNLISSRWSLSLPTNPVWWRSMHLISSYRGNRPTKHTPTNKHTNRIDYSTLRRS